MKPIYPKKIVDTISNFHSSFELLRSTEPMTRIILSGSIVVDALMIILLLFSWLAFGHNYVLGRIMICVAILFYLIVISYFVFKKQPRLGAWMLVILYGFVGIFILHIWGINAPIGVLIVGFVIFLTGVMLGSKHILFVTVVIISTLTLLQYLNIIGISQPNHELLNNDSSFADVAGYSVIFTIFAIIAWLSGSKMEHTLERAIKAEENLQKERDELARRVEAQTKRIIDAQQKELKQLYKFAELGQLTAIILHELANNLSILTLDIDDLKERHENSIAIEHAKESIYYIDTIIDQLRNQIKDSDDIIKFDACKNTKDCLDQLKHKLNSSDIILNSQVRDSTDSLIIGDPLRLSQAIIILVTNAAQAHQNGHSEIYVDISSTKANVLISVKDFGTGISQDARRDLFQPQKSKKNGSLGIGLYITKQIIVTHFKGHIWLSPATEYTQFNIEIPKANKGIKRLRSQNARTAPTPHT